MDLYDLVHLSAEIVDNIEQTILSSHIHITRLSDRSATLLVLHKFVTGDRVIECLASGCVVEGDKLAGEEVVLDLEESDVLRATSDQACVHNVAELETDKIKIAKLSRQKLNLLVLGQLLESINQDQLSSLEVLAVDTESILLN